MVAGSESTPRVGVDVPEHVRSAAALAFATYAGESTTDAPEDATAFERARFEAALAAVVERGLARDLSLVWGPGLYRVPDVSRLYDNFAVILADDARTEIVVAVRGTKGGATLDWLLEDLWLTPTVPWERVAPAAAGGPATRPPPPTSRTARRSGSTDCWTWSSNQPVSHRSRASWTG